MPLLKPVTPVVAAGRPQGGRERRVGWWGLGWSGDRLSPSVLDWGQLGPLCGLPRIESEWRCPLPEMMVLGAHRNEVIQPIGPLEIHLTFVVAEGA